MTRAWIKLTAVLIAWGSLVSLAGAQQSFPLKDGDTVVMLGDSITAQHLHSNYIEAYCLARFPQWQLRFRNAGVGGDTVPRGLARLDYDVLAWKPAIVTIELGMNDSGGGLNSVNPYLDQMKTLIGRIKAAGALPVFLTASPVNDGTTSDKLAGRNITLDKMATEIVKLAQGEKLPVADQFHMVLDLWGQNMASPGKVNLQGDGVHPGPPGQLTMAWACLKGLGAPALVSNAVVSVTDGKVTGAEGCQVTDLKCAPDAVSLTRLDNCLPFPIPDNARDGLKLVPLAKDLSHCGLTVAGLKPGKYEIKVDGVAVATATADELAVGIEMGTPEKGPIYDQLQRVTNLIGEKARLVGGWRDTAKYPVAPWLGPDLTAKVQERKQGELDSRRQAVEAVDGQIHDAVQPKPHVISITPAA
ncbi:MAG: SGNH/GDSL hydrolase family protein [Armatimonadia bacterium]